jgi:drug/metabolite transporter (DMT)-like permease
MPYLLLVSIIWGLSFGLIKVSFGGVPPAFLSASRLLLALLIFLPFMRFRGLSMGIRLKLMGLGAVQYGLMYYLLFSSFAWLDGHQVALYTITTPLFIAAWYCWQQRLWKRKLVVAALLAVAGAAIIQFQPGKPLSGWQGFLMLQGANACFAFGQLYYRELRKSGQISADVPVFGWLYVGAVLLSLCLMTVENSWTAWAALSTSQWQALIYLGTVASGLAFFLWNYGAARTNPTSLAVMNNLKIPIAVLLAVFVFGESANWIQLIPGALIMLLALRQSEKSD